MRMGLERQLTLSHLAVTVLSAGILTALILLGYVLYLRTDWSARWAGETAAFFADDLALMHEDEGAARLDPALSQRFVDGTVLPVDVAQSVLPPADPADEESVLFDDPTYTEWLLVIGLDGQIVAGNYGSRYPAGVQLAADPPPGFQPDVLDRQGSGDFQYRRSGDLYGGQAAILDASGNVLGWVYYQTSDSNAFILAGTARTLGGALAGAVVVAVFVSAAAGTLLARRFSGRLQQISQASADFAAGHLDRTVHTEGDDEIGQLGQQFNRMAGRIAGQMQELRQLAEDNARLATTASALAALEERNRLARELHDAVKQKLFGISLLTGSIRPLLETNPAVAQERLEHLSRLTSETLEEMDAIIQELRPASLEDRGLAEALGALVENWRGETGIEVRLHVAQAREIPIGLEQALLRVAQEGLSNVARHARAHSVDLSLHYADDRVMLTIADDGRGFAVDSPRPSTSLGLAGMAERVAELDGLFSIESHPGQGTALSVQLPTAEKEQSFG